MMESKLFALTIHLLTIRRASLIKQAEGLAIQRRAILSEVAEVEKIIGRSEENIPVTIGESDSVS